jgi:hypothetical protein
LIQSIDSATRPTTTTRNKHERGFAYATTRINEPKATRVPDFQRAKNRTNRLRESQTSNAINQTNGYASPRLPAYQRSQREVTGVPDCHCTCTRLNPRRGNRSDSHHRRATKLNELRKATLSQQATRVPDSKRATNNQTTHASPRLQTCNNQTD